MEQTSNVTTEEVPGRTSANELIQYIRIDGDIREKIEQKIKEIKGIKESELTSADYERIQKLEKDIIILNSQLYGERVGVMLAKKVAEEEQIGIGFSFLNYNKNDRWDRVSNKRIKGFGKDIARIRATKFLSNDHNIFYTIPPKYSDSVFNFIQRCISYYGFEKMPVWVKEPQSFSNEIEDNMFLNNDPNSFYHVLAKCATELGEERKEQEEEETIFECEFEELM